MSAVSRASQISRFHLSNGPDRGSRTQSRVVSSRLAKSRNDCLSRCYHQVLCVLDCRHWWSLCLSWWLWHHAARDSLLTWMDRPSCSLERAQMAHGCNHCSSQAAPHVGSHMTASLSCIHTSCICFTRSSWLEEPAYIAGLRATFYHTVVVDRARTCVPVSVSSARSSIWNTSKISNASCCGLAKLSRRVRFYSCSTWSTRVSTS